MAVAGQRGHREGLGELREEDLFGQHGRADGVAPAGHLEGEFRGEGLDAGGHLT